MKITRREAEVLDFLSTNRANMTRIALAIGTKKPNMVRYAKKIERYALVDSERQRRDRVLTLAKEIASEFSNLKGRFPGLSLTDVLVGAVPFVLASDRTRQPFRLAELDLPVMTAKRTLAKLRGLGLVSMQKKGGYGIREEATVVSDFCRKVIMHSCNAEAKRELGRIERVVYSFSSAREVGAVFVTTEEAKPKRYWPTAYSLFERYGLQLIHASKFYYANAEPDLGDVIIHTLALSKDARTAAYVAFLILKNKYDSRLLLKKKQLFGLSRGYIWELIEFIESSGKKTFEGLTFKEVEGMMHGKL